MAADRLRPARHQQDADGGGVDRLCQGFLQRDLAEEAVLDIGRAPGADAQRRIHARYRRGHPGLQRGQPDERLEGGAGLAAGQHRSIIRRFAEVSTADHGADGAGGGVEDDDGALGDPGGGAGAVQQGGQAGLGHRLVMAVEGGPQHRIGVRRDQACDCSATQSANQPGDAGFGGKAICAAAACACCAVMLAVFHHRGEHLLAAGECGGGVDARVEARRRARQAGQHCRLRQRQAAGGDVEVRLRRRIHAPGAGARDRRG